MNEQLKKNLQVSARKYRSIHKYVSVMGLRDATTPLIAEIKAYLTELRIPWEHRTAGLKFNGIIVYGNFKRKQQLQ